jgi:peroxin-13
MWDFAPEQGAAVQGVDLEVKKGDLVAVLSKSDPLGQPSQWWRCRARDGRVGYLPAPYLAPVQPRQPGQVATIKSASRAGSQAGSRADSLDSRTTGMAPVLPGGKAGDLSVESFQKSQFYS